MRIVFASLYAQAPGALDDPDAWLDRFPLHAHLPAALGARGHEVFVVHTGCFERTVLRRGVGHHFVDEGPLARAAGAAWGARSGAPSGYYVPAVRSVARALSLRPDVVHVHGFGQHLNLALLRAASRAPYVAHFHGAEPPRSSLARRVQRANLDAARALLVTVPSQVDPFVAAGALSSPAKARALVELSSHFRPLPRDEARALSGVDGDPAVVATGRLDPTKDPQTTLEGFARLAEARPGARLWWCWLEAPMEPEVRARIDADPRLRGRVRLLGRLPHDELEALYSAADFFVQSSVREYSGGALLEAMACGAVPVVTDIPAHRAMTDDGRAGLLFPVGDAGALARHLCVDDRDARSARAREHFARSLSYDAMALALEGYYREAVASPRGGV